MVCNSICFQFIKLSFLLSNQLLCIEKFYCCKIPGTKWNYKPKRANWWGCFDSRNLCKVPINTWMTGLWRNGCNFLYCLEEARYSQPSTNLITSFYSLGKHNYRRKIFRVSSNRLNWHQAQVECRKQGGELASPENKFENDSIIKLLGNKNGWIGINDIKKEGKWTLLDYRPLSFKAWLPGEPNNFRGMEDCAKVLASRKGWNDDSCNGVDYYVCEFFVIKSFTVSKNHLNWHEAKTECRNQGGRLADPRNKIENGEISRLVGNRYAWIGSNDLRKEGKWTTLDNRPLPFAPWLPGEPNNWGGNEDCAVIVGSRQGKWNDGNCSGRGLYVCEVCALKNKLICAVRA